MACSSARVEVAGQFEPRRQQLARFLQQGISRRFDEVRINPLKVTQGVEIERARFDRLAIAGSQFLKMRIGGGGLD